MNADESECHSVSVETGTCLLHDSGLFDDDAHDLCQIMIQDRLSRLFVPYSVFRVDHSWAGVRSGVNSIEAFRFGGRDQSG